MVDCEQTTMQDSIISESENEYEYEYDETETETFYVNIDLTSYNGPIRQPQHGQTSSRVEQRERREDKEGEDVSSPVEERGMRLGGAEDSAMNMDETGDGNETVDNMNDRIQIMELHSKNPIVSYRNYIFSCEWADMIGTDMHFVSREDSEPDPTYAKNAEDYSLIAANPIKIIGRRAQFGRSAADTVTGNSVNESSNQTEVGVSSSSAGNGLSFLSQQQESKSAQVSFLQELMDIKHQRGETDMMRMVYGTRRGQNFEDRVRKWAITEERWDMIHQLNRAALGGDQNAIAKLEDLYDLIEDDGEAAAVDTIITG